MINFETLATKFLTITEQVKISSNAQCLYFQLLKFFRNNFWLKTLEIDNMRIHHATGLSRKQILFARNELEKLTFIKYNKGSGSKSGTYELIDTTNAKIDSIIAISKLPEAKIDNLRHLSEQVDNLYGESRFWGQYILQVLSNATNANSGVYNNFYATTQTFLKAQQTIQIDTIYKLIEIMQNKPDLKDRDAYILTVVANTIKQKIVQGAQNV